MIKEEWYHLLVFILSFFQTNYTNWDHPEPDDWKGNEDCTGVRVKFDTHHKWVDIYCGFKIPYVCKKESYEVTSQKVTSNSALFSKYTSLYETKETTAVESFPSTTVTTSTASQGNYQTFIFLYIQMTTHSKL